MAETGFGGLLSGGMTGSPLRRQPVSPLGVLVFVACMLLGIAAGKLTGMPALVALFALVGMYFLFSIKVAKQWSGWRY
jgi:hypothetical protein